MLVRFYFACYSLAVSIEIICLCHIGLCESNFSRAWLVCWHFNENRNFCPPKKVYHGIEKRQSDTLVKYFSVQLAVNHTFCLTVSFCCCSFRCAFFIAHFCKCFNVHCANWINRMIETIANSSFVNSFNSTTQPKGKLNSIYFWNLKIKMFHFPLALEDGSWKQLKFTVALS